jgi:hypothetical protein
MSRYASEVMGEITNTPREDQREVLQFAVKGRYLPATSSNTCRALVA